MTTSGRERDDEERTVVPSGASPKGESIAKASIADTNEDEDEGEDEDEDGVDEAGRESFPASDPPPWTSTGT